MNYDKRKMNSEATAKAEIFRHLRPRWYNRTKHELEPQTHGGISFLLRPAGIGTYEFWIYICPQDASFSARQAVKSLREVVSRGTVPWGTIRVTNEPILDQLTRFILHEQQALPSEIGHQVLATVMVNWYAQHKLEEAQRKASKKVQQEYEE